MLEKCGFRRIGAPTVDAEGIVEVTYRLDEDGENNAADSCRRPCTIGSSSPTAVKTVIIASRGSLAVLAEGLHSPASPPDTSPAATSRFA